MPTGVWEGQVTAEAPSTVMWMVVFMGGVWQRRGEDARRGGGEQGRLATEGRRTQSKTREEVERNEGVEENRGEEARREIKNKQKKFLKRIDRKTNGR